MAKIEMLTRGDGLRIFMKDCPFTNKVMVTIGTLAGSASDPPDKLGLFHFFEHMAFQGTVTKSAEQVAELLSRYCISYNASTGKLSTQYYGTTNKRNFAKMFEILADIYANSTFPEKEFCKEREVIKNEIAMYKDKDGHLAFGNLARILYRENPARQSALGTSESLDSINRETLIRLHKEFYSWKNTFIIVSGRFEKDELLKLINSNFPVDFENVAPEKKSWSDESDDPLIKKIAVIEKPQREKAIILLGCKTPANFPDKEQLILNLIANLLGQGGSSPLYSELRQKRGLVYSASTVIYDERPLYQMMVFCAETLPKNISEVKKLMIKIAKSHPLEEAKFLEAKERMKDHYECYPEGVGEWNQIIAGIIELGEDVLLLNNFTETIWEILDSITFADVLAMRKKYLTSKRLAFSIVKPV